MNSLLTTVHLVVTVLLIFSILLQHRSSGLSATFGGSGATTYIQRRGAEKALYTVSVWLGFAFLVIPLIQWYV